MAKSKTINVGSRSPLGLAEVLAPYKVVAARGIAPSKIQADFKQVLELHPPAKTLAVCVAEAIKSPETRSLGEYVGIVYAKSQKRRRRRLLNVIYKSAPTVFEPGVAKFPLSEGVSIKIPTVDVEKAVAQAESIKPGVIDVVAEHWASEPSVLLQLDSKFHGLVLQALASSHPDLQTGGGGGGLQGDPTVEEEEDSAFIYHASAHQLSGEIPRPTSASAPAAAAEAPPPPPASATSAAGAAAASGSTLHEPHTEPAPPPRYADLQAFRDSEGTRGDPLLPAQPFKTGEWYQMEVSVVLKPKGLKPAEGWRPIREPRQQKDVDILVLARSDDFTIKQPVSKLVLPPKGDSSHQAVFRVSPLRASNAATDLLEIKFYLLYQLNLLEVFVVRGESVRSTDEEVSRYGLSPAVNLTYDRQRQSDANDFDLMTPVALNIHVEPYQQHYRMIFTFKKNGNAGNNDEYGLPAPVQLNPSQLEDAISGVRKALFQVSSSDILGVRVQGDSVEYRDHLEVLAKAGRDLWTLLFEHDGQNAISTIGDWLKNNPLPEGSKIQICVESAASAFVFAWSLLYDDQSPPGPENAHLGFWGMRYVIEQRPVRIVIPSLNTPRLLDLQIEAMYWQFDQTPGQKSYLLDLVGKTKTARLVGGAPIEDAETALAFMSSSHVLYFYTHGFTRLPNGERYGVTLNDFVRLYNALPVDSSTRLAWKYIADDIMSRQFQSDKSYIELTHGRLELDALYRNIKKLPCQPIVILNMCDSAQVTPSLADSFIDFFLTRGARAVVGTECSIRPVFADYVGKALLDAALRAQPLGKTLRNIRLEAAKNRNLLGLAYTLFGAADAALEPPVLA